MTPAIRQLTDNAMGIIINRFAGWTKYFDISSRSSGHVAARNTDELPVLTGDRRNRYPP